MEAAARENESIKAAYSKDKKIGQGTYADVFLGHQLSTGRKIAIKKIKAGQFKDGLDMSAIREVKFLQELRHPNIIELLDVFSSKSNLNLVLEFLDTDLELIIKDKALLFQPADIKSWMLMMLKGIDFCHRNWVLHRDLKPNNLLIAKDGVLRLADFGLAREYADPRARMTSQVVTRWYRAPELLMGARAYGGGVDIWAAGCIFAELLLRVPYMAGDTDMHQLTLICKALGTPTEAEWPGHKKLPDYVKLPHEPKQSLHALFQAASQPTLVLLAQMLKFNPLSRVTARKALGSYYFTTEPRPTAPDRLPKPTAELAPRALPPEALAHNAPAKRELDSPSLDGAPAQKVALCQGVPVFNKLKLTRGKSDRGFVVLFPFSALPFCTAFSRLPPAHLATLPLKMLSRALIAAALVRLAVAQATAAQLATVDGQYVNSGFETPIGNSLAFNIPLKSQALMNVAYNGQVLSNGQALTAAQVGALPSITIEPSTAAASNFTNARFTVMLADAAALGNPDRQGDYRHFLATGATVGANGALNPGTVVTQYAGPGPAAGEGPHRYAWLLFQQPASFNAAATQGLNAPGHWQVQQFVQQANLGSLVAASFFTVENGQASYSVPASSAFVAAASTAAPASTTAAAAASGATQVASASGASALPTTSIRTGAAASVVASLSGLFAAAVGVAALA